MQVGRMMNEAQLEMNQYGELGLGKANGATLLSVLNRFSSDYGDIIEGTSTQVALSSSSSANRAHSILA
jgi:hypothetical protein